jgi:hypothetical protein
LVRRKFQRTSAFGLILYFLTMTFASVDWVMSLQPEWYSTIYGMLTVMAQLLSAMAFALAALPLLMEYPSLRETVRTEHIRDLGAFLLTAVVLWAYLAFSQYLVIWAGNLPREVTWYIIRGNTSWLWLGLLVIGMQFVLPFALLLSAQAKRNSRLLAGLAVAILFASLLDQFWQVAPVFHPAGLAVHWLDLVLPAAIGGIWLAAFAWLLERTPQVTVPEDQAESRMGQAARQEAGQTTASGPS